MPPTRIGFIGGTRTAPSGLPQRFLETFVAALEVQGWVYGRHYTLVRREVKRGTKDELVALRRDLEALHGDQAVAAIVTLDSRALSELHDAANPEGLPIITTATEQLTGGRIGSILNPRGRVSGVFTPAWGHLTGMLEVADTLLDVKENPETKLGVLTYNATTRAEAREGRRSRQNREIVRAAASLDCTVANGRLLIAEAGDNLATAWECVRPALESLVAQGLGERDLFVVREDAIFNYCLLRIVKFAHDHGWFSVYPHRHYVNRGGNLSLGVDRHQTIRQATQVLVETITSGHPAPLAIASGWELAVNDFTFKELGFAGASVLQPFATHFYADEHWGVVEPHR
jgi:hypothetical protein